MSWRKEKLKTLEKINQTVNIPQQPINMGVRDIISKVEETIRKMPDHKEGDSYPLKHSFADGLYIRELTIPGKILTVTKIHKYAHAAFLLKGEISVLEEGGARRVKAPASFITPAGTKRIVYHHTEVVLTTVHATNKTDLKEIEDEIILKDFEPIIDVKAEEVKISEFVNEVTKEDKDD